MLRYVGELPNAAPDYSELGVRLANLVSDPLEFSRAGSNLLDDRHVDYTVPSGHELRRSVCAEARFIF